MRIGPVGFYFLVASLPHPDETSSAHDRKYLEGNGGKSMTVQMIVKKMMRDHPYFEDTTEAGTGRRVWARNECHHAKGSPVFSSASERQSLHVEASNRRRYQQSNAAH